MLVRQEKFSSEAEEPAVFLWFPRKSDYEYIPPALLNESLDHKLERVVKLAKARLTISWTIMCLRISYILFDGY